MTAKQEAALEKVIGALPDGLKESYQEVAEYAMSLGYMPALKGVRQDYVDFTKSRVKKSILKISSNPNFWELAMKFYALPEYSGIFSEALKMRLAYWSKLGYEAKCFGCGNCDGTLGYGIRVSDGKQGFLCGYGVVPLPKFNAENVAEVKDALRQQDEFFIKLAM